MTRRRYAALGVLLASAALLAATTRTWLAGRVADPVLGGSLAVATGSQAAPAAVGLGLVSLAALVAALTAGPRMRVVATTVLLASAAAATYAVARVLADPGATLGARAAEQAGRTGRIPVEATVTAWAWIALGLGAAATGAAALLAVASRGTAGLSRRFDRPAPDSDRSTWDALSEGRDPTTGPDAQET